MDFTDIAKSKVSEMTTAYLHEEKELIIHEMALLEERLRDVEREMFFRNHPECRNQL